MGGDEGGAHASAGHGVIARQLGGDQAAENGEQNQEREGGAAPANAGEEPDGQGGFEGDPDETLGGLGEPLIVDRGNGGWRGFGMKF